MINQSKDLLQGDKHIPFKQMMKYTFKYIKPERKKFIIAFILIIFNVLLDTLLPILVGFITNNLKSNDINIKMIIFVACGYFIISIINQIFLYFESMILQKAGESIIYKLRMDVFTHIEKMSINQFDEMSVGSLVTRVCNYTQSMSDLFTNVLVNVLRNVLTIFTVYGIMFYISWKLSLILLPVIVLVFIISYFFSKLSSKLFKKEKKQLAI